MLINCNFNIKLRNENSFLRKEVRMASNAQGIHPLTGTQGQQPLLPEGPPLSPPPNKDNLITSLAKGSLPEHIFLAGDVLSITKAGHTLSSTIPAKEVPSPDPGFNGNIAGITSAGITGVSGILNTARGSAAAEKAYKMGDDVGTAAGVLRSAIRGPSEMMRATTSITTNSLDIANKSASIPKVTLGLGITTAVGSCLGSTAIGITAFKNLRERHSIAKNFYREAKKGDDSGVGYLKGMLCITEQDEQEVLEDVFNPQSKALHERAFNYIAEKALVGKQTEEYKKLKKLMGKKPRDLKAIEDLLKSTDIDTAGREDLIGKVKEKFKEYDQLTPDGQKKLLALVTQEIDYKKQKKEAVFIRTVGDETKKLIESCEGVLDSKIIASAKAGLTRSRNIMSVILGTCLLSLAFNILAQVITSGVYAFIELGLNLVTSLIFLGVDGYFLYKAYAKNQIDWKERCLMLLVTIGAVIGGSLATALAKSSIVGIVITSTLLSVYLLITLFETFNWKSKEDVESSDRIKTPEKDHFNDSGLGSDWVRSDLPDFGLQQS